MMDVNVTPRRLLVEKNKKKIKELKNSCSKEYLEFKKHIHSKDIAWYFNAASTDSKHQLGEDYPFYSHTIMERPNIIFDKPWTKQTSELFNPAYNILKQILEDNDIKISVIYRINLNATFPVSTKIKKSVYHTDLEIPHQNLILYMSKFKGGEFYIKENKQEVKYTPKEDNIFLFDGELQHSVAPPVGLERRIIMVVNFL